MNYSTYTWDLVWALDSTLLASSKTPDTFVHSIHPNNQQEKAKNLEMRSNSQQIILNCFDLTFNFNVAEGMAEIKLDEVLNQNETFA